MKFIIATRLILKEVKEHYDQKKRRILTKRDAGGAAGK